MHAELRDNPPVEASGSVSITVRKSDSSGYEPDTHHFREDISHKIYIKLTVSRPSPHHARQ